MKTSLVDAEIVVRDTVFSANFTQPFSFNQETFEDASSQGMGYLLEQNDPFLFFEVNYISSSRIGPSRIAPTRYEMDLSLGYLTKEPSHVVDYQLLEGVAKNFQEQTISGVRFRTFTPYAPRKIGSFTACTGVIDFQFELSRGTP